MSSAGERARLFVALELPADVIAGIVAWRSRALAPIEGLRLLPPQSLHVTLCFLGSVPAADADAIGDACSAAATPRLEASGLSLSDFVWLPPRRPGVAAVRIDDPRGELGALQSAVAAALVAGGWYEPEARPYLPHVTVARAGRRARIRRPRSVEAPPAVAFAGSAVTLFRSRPGSVYEPLRAVPGPGDRRSSVP